MQSVMNHAPIQPFDTETGPSSVENFLVAMNITGDARQKALLLHLTGECVHDIYDTFAADEDGYAETKIKLNGYFSPKKNTQYLVYQFRKAVKQPGEKLDTYQTRLRMRAKDFFKFKFIKKFKNCFVAL